MHDTGVGMTLDEFVQHLGIIAKSGSPDFLQNASQDTSNIIGQFGVGFYSTFVVADMVEVFTKTYDATKGSQSGPAHIANVAKQLGVPLTEARQAVRTRRVWPVSQCTGLRSDRDRCHSLMVHPR